VVIAELFGTLGIKLDDASWTNANQALELLNKTVGKAFSAIKNTINEGFEAISSVADEANNVGRVAEQFGMAATSLEELQNAAMFADVSVEMFQRGLGQLARTASEAAAGSKEAVEAMAGLDLKDATGQLVNVDELLLKVSDKMQGMESATERVAYAQKVFGRGGAALVPMLAKGRAEIERNIAIANKYSYTLSAGQRKASEGFEVAKKSYMLAAGSIKSVFASAANISRFSELYQRMADVISSPVVRSAIESISHVFGGLVSIVVNVVKRIETIFKAHGNDLIAVMHGIEYALGYIYGVLEVIIDEIDTKLAEAFKPIKELRKWLDERTGGGLESDVNECNESVSGLADNIRANESTFAKLRRWIETPSGEDGAIGDIHKLMNGMMKLSALVESINTSVGTAVIKAIKVAFEGLWDAVKYTNKLVGESIDWLLRKIGAPVRAMNELVGGVLTGTMPTRNVLETPSTMPMRTGLASWAPAPERLMSTQPANQSPVTIPTTNTFNFTITESTDANGTADAVAKKVAEEMDRQNKFTLETVQGQR